VCSCWCSQSCVKECRLSASAASTHKISETEYDIKASNSSTRILMAPRNLHGAENVIRFNSHRNYVVTNGYNQPTNHRFTATIQVNLHQLAPPVKNSRILLVQSFTARMPLLTATSTFRLGRRCRSSPQQCYLHPLCTPNN